MTSFDLVNEKANKVLIALETHINEQKAKKLSAPLAEANMIAIRALLDLWHSDDQALSQLIRHGLAPDLEFGYRKRLVQILDLLKD
jgi:hypothetical protein